MHFVPELKVPRFESSWFIVWKILGSGTQGESHGVPLSAKLWHFGGSNQDLLIQVEFFTIRVSRNKLCEQELGLHFKHFVLELKVPRSESLWLIAGKV